MPIAHYRDLDASQWILSSAFGDQKSVLVGVAGTFSGSTASGSNVALISANGAANWNQSQAFSVSIWVRLFNATNQYFTNFPNSSGQGLMIYSGDPGLGSTRRIGAFLADNNQTNWLKIAGAFNTDDGSWNHYLFTYDPLLGTTMLDHSKFFINNVEQTTTRTLNGSSTFNFSTPNGFYCGHTGTSRDQIAPGSNAAFEIDDISTWGVALNSSDRTALYNAGHPGDLATHTQYPSLQNWYYMGDGDDTYLIVKDRKGSVNLPSQNLAPGNIVSDVPGSGTIPGSGGLVSGGLAPQTTRYFIVDPQVVNTLGGTKTSTITAATIASSAIVQSNFDPLQPSADFTRSNWVAKGWNDPDFDLLAFRNDVRDWVHNNLSSAVLNPGSNEFDIYLLDKTISGTRYLAPIIYLGSDGPSIDAPAFLDLHSGLFTSPSSQSVDFGNVADENGSDPFSISLWMRFNDTNAPYLEGAQIVGKFDLNFFGWSVTFSGNDSVIIFTLGDGDMMGGILVRDSYTSYLNNVWYHIVITYDGSKSGSGVKMYTNGSLNLSSSIWSDSFLGNSSNSESTVVGNAPNWNPGQYFNGYLDDISKWPIALSASNVTELYNLGKPSDITLTSFYGSGFSASTRSFWMTFENSWNDKSQNSFVGTPINSPTFSTIVP